MAEESESNRPSSAPIGTARSASRSPLWGPAARADADELLGALLAPEREDSVPEEVVGVLVAIDEGKITVEARRRFEIQAEDVPDSLRRAIGRTVGVLVMDGQVRWRLVEAAPELEKGERP